MYKKYPALAGSKRVQSFNMLCAQKGLLLSKIDDIEVRLSDIAEGESDSPRDRTETQTLISLKDEAILTLEIINAALTNIQEYSTEDLLAVVKSIPKVFLSTALQLQVNNLLGHFGETAQAHPGGNAADAEDAAGKDDTEENEEPLIGILGFFHDLDVCDPSSFI